MSERRNRSHSLPLTSTPDNLKKLQKDIGNNFRISESDESSEFEADDEQVERRSPIYRRQPSIVAKNEISQAKRLSEKLSTSSRNTSPILLIDSTTTAPPESKKSSFYSLEEDNLNSKNSLLDSIYSFGGAVWNFIKGKVKVKSNLVLI